MPLSDLNIPVLETRRLILRAHRLEDFEAMIGIWTDPIVHMHFHGPALTREDIWGRFQRGFGQWLVMGYGLWAVEEKSSHAYVGTVGMMEVKRDIEPPLEGIPEAGWTFASQVHGRGYATEAMLAGLKWADEALGGTRMFCIIAPGNKASIRVAEKCGFRYSHETSYKGEPTGVYFREA